ncbi:MAG: hypothetical protein AAFZ92_02815 [Pseudomonadota bacterium]
MKRSASNNPVAKYARRFNKAAVHKDRKKALKRGQTKHKKQVYQAVA